MNVKCILKKKWPPQISGFQWIRSLRSHRCPPDINVSVSELYDICPYDGKVLYPLCEILPAFLSHRIERRPHIQGSTQWPVSCVDKKTTEEGRDTRWILRNTLPYQTQGSEPQQRMSRRNHQTLISRQRDLWRHLSWSRTYYSRPNQ